MSEQKTYVIRRTSLLDGDKMYYVGGFVAVPRFSFEQTRATRFASREDAADVAIGQRGWTVVRLVRKVAP